MRSLILFILSFIQTFNIMAQKEIKTSIEIEASPEIIWQTLLNFDAYPSWNPFITKIEGAPKVGSKLNIIAGGMGFKPTVLIHDENKEFRWLGKLLFKGLFDGEHIFQIIDNHDGSCTFKHEEKFKGLLIGLFSKKLDHETKPGFEAMNLKLKELSEKRMTINK